MKKKLPILIAVGMTLLVAAGILFFALSGSPVSKAQSFDELLDLGEKYLTEQNYEEALLCFTKAIEIDPNNIGAYLGGARAYIGMGDHDGAIRFITDAAQKTGDPELQKIADAAVLSVSDLCLAVMDVYLGLGQPEIAQSIIEGEYTVTEDPVLLPYVEAFREKREVPRYIPGSLSGGSASTPEYAVLNNKMLRDNPYYDASTITEITFLDSFAAAPADAWDFSLAQDRGVLAWCEETHLYIAGDGGIAADADASKMFGDTAEGIRLPTFNHLKTIVFGNAFDTSNVTNVHEMFAGCGELSSIDISCFNTGNVIDMSSMFLWCYALNSLDLSSFNTEKVTDMSNMFNGCGSIPSLDLSSFNTEHVTSMLDMFCSCASLSSLDLSSFNTEKVTDMSGMFQNCLGLISLDLSPLRTDNVTKMSYMFSGCGSSELTTIDLSSFQTGNVTDMSGMFWFSSNLQSLDLSSFNTENVTTMSTMFMGCSGLTDLDLSSFRTEKLTDMGYMFSGCSQLVSLNLSSFRTENVTNMGWAFQWCPSLTELDLSSFDIRNVTDMFGMFFGCTNLTALTFSGVSASAADKTDMFYGTIFEGSWNS